MKNVIRVLNILYGKKPWIMVSIFLAIDFVLKCGRGSNLVSVLLSYGGWATSLSILGHMDDLVWICIIGLILGGMLAYVLGRFVPKFAQVLLSICAVLCTLSLIWIAKIQIKALYAGTLPTLIGSVEAPGEKSTVKIEGDTPPFVCSMLVVMALMATLSPIFYRSATPVGDVESAYVLTASIGTIQEIYQRVLSGDVQKIQSGDVTRLRRYCAEHDCKGNAGCEDFKKNVCGLVSSIDRAPTVAEWAKPRTIKLQDPEEAVTFTTDANLITAAWRKFFDKNWGMKSDTWQEAIPGSELNARQQLLYPLENWKEFQNDVVSGRIVQDWIDHVPEIPELLPDVSYEQWVRMTGPLYTLPYYLAKWGEHRMVFKVKSTEYLERFSNQQENHITELPWDAFILQLDEPIKQKPYKQSKLNDYKTLFFAREPDGSISTLLIPEEIDLAHIDPKDRKMLREVLAIKNLPRGPGGVMVPQRMNKKMKRTLELYKKMQRIRDLFNAYGVYFHQTVINSDGSLGMRYTLGPTGLILDTYENMPTGSEAFDHVVYSLVKNFANVVADVVTELDEIVNPEGEIQGGQEGGDTGSGLGGAVLPEEPYVPTAFFEVPYSGVFNIEHSRRGDRDRVHIRGESWVSRPHSRRPHRRWLTNADGRRYWVPVSGSIIHEELFDLIYGPGSARRIRRRWNQDG